MERHSGLAPGGPAASLVGAGVAGEGAAGGPPRISDSASRRRIRTSTSSQDKSPVSLGR